MFQGQKYLTKSVDNEIPVWLQLNIWGMIDEWVLEGKEVDYLQIFELYPVHEGNERAQTIVHRQEQPKYEQKRTILTDEPISGKVWVMDSGDYCTMLLPEDY